MDPVETIQQFNSGRDPQLLAIKYRKMRESTFAFLRGTCHLFYDRLAQEDIFKDLPLVWSCGDLHLENFGTYKGDNRLVYFDINDFDEAALAPAGWDLVRMLTSIQIGVDRFHSEGRSEYNSLGTHFLQAYSSSLASGKSYWVERETAVGPVQALLKNLQNRSRQHLLDTRTDIKGNRRAIRVDGKKALPASKKQLTKVMEFMASFARGLPIPEFYEVLDIARRIAGTGSLGVERFVILVQGKGFPDGNYLLDLKSSSRSTLASHIDVQQPRWLTEAHRIVGLQQRSQAVPMAFLAPVQVGGMAYVLRALQPTEDRISFAQSKLSAGELRQLLVTMGNTVAWAHLRGAGRQNSDITDKLVDFGKRKKWQQELLKISLACAQVVCQDATTFNNAYDVGALVGKGE